MLVGLLLIWPLGRSREELVCASSECVPRSVASNGVSFDVVAVAVA
jgi:hypothetical protein